MKRVGASHRGRASIADHVSDPFGSVSGDVGDPGASTLPRCLQRIEEGVHGRAFAAGTGPHQPAAVVVDDDGAGFAVGAAPVGNGLARLKQTLELLHGDAAGMEFSKSERGGARVCLRLPRAAS